MNEKNIYIIWRMKMKAELKMNIKRSEGKKERVNHILLLQICTYRVIKE